jgi:peptidoglycan/LPS O-acetylase OafA/YrhL
VAGGSTAGGPPQLNAVSLGGTRTCSAQGAVSVELGIHPVRLVAALVGAVAMLQAWRQHRQRQHDPQARQDRIRDRLWRVLGWAGVGTITLVVLAVVADELGAPSWVALLVLAPGVACAAVALMASAWLGWRSAGR